MKSLGGWVDPNPSLLGHGVGVTPLHHQIYIYV